MKRPQTVHDEFITSILQNLFYARRFLQRALGKHSKHIDWDTLELADNSYVRHNLKRYISDVVFSVKYQNGVSLNLLLVVEHKSYVPGTKLPIQIQLLGYVLARYEQYLAQYKAQKKAAKDNGDPVPEFQLPVVVPIVVYHGQRRWNPRSWWQLFGKKTLPAELRTYVPYFEYLLLDYHEMTDQQLDELYAHDGDLKLVSKLMKHILDNDLENQLLQFVNEFHEAMKTADGHDLLEKISLYLSKQLELDRIEYVINTAEQLNQSEKFINIMRSAYDTLIARGEEKGKAIGKAEGKEEMIVAMLKEGYGSEQIARIAGMPVEAITVVQQKHQI